MTPDTIHVVTPTDRVDQAWSGGTSVLAGLSGLWAMASNFPLNGAIALAGVLTSGGIQAVKMLTDRRIVELARDNFHLQAAVRAADERTAQADAREERHLARIASLVAQLDAAHAARDRMAAVMMEHSGELGDHLKHAMAEAVKPVIAPASVSPHLPHGAHPDDIPTTLPGAGGPGVDPLDTPDPDA